MKLLSIIMILLCVATLNAQDYKSFYFEKHQGDKFYQQGDYSEALLQYEASSEMVKFVPTTILMKFLKAAKKAKNKPLQNKYQTLIERQKKGSTEYAHLVGKLDSLFSEDQKVRTEKQRLIKYYWKNIDNKSVINSSKFLKAKKAREAWRSTDSLNIQILLSMFEEYGFLDESKIGYDRFRYVEHILLHFDKDTSNVVLQPILDKALTNGQITPYRYAIILDRHLYACNLSQKYYQWPMLRSDPKLSEEDIKQIIILRENIGLYGKELKINESRGHWSVSY